MTFLAITLTGVNLIYIEKIDPLEKNSIKKCITLAQYNYLDNLVLLGDCYPPCKKLTEFYGLFDSSGEIKSFFAVFSGFNYPSAVLPYGLPLKYRNMIFQLLKKLMKGKFSFVTFDIPLKDIERNFDVSDVSNELCMKIDSIEKFYLNSKESDWYDLIQVEQQSGLASSIKDFYRSIMQYPWHEVQMESGYYQLIVINDRIIACGGTHFETPILANLGNFHVLEEFRGRGVGKTIVWSITSKILEKKRLATLFVSRSNIEAISLYRKLGFRDYKPVTLITCSVKNP